MTLPPTIHATAVAIGHSAVLLVGPSGSGKSDLALRLIDRGATLIADDRVVVTRVADRLLAAPPPTLAGRIEVRGVGIVDLPWVGGVRVALVADVALLPDRLPWPVTRDVAGVRVPLVAVAPFEPSACLKVELALGGGKAFVARPARVEC